MTSRASAKGLPRLSARTLARLPSFVAAPRYERDAVAPGIVHLGVGAFHRAHQALFVDDALAAGERDWGIVGVSLQSARTRDALGPQDNLYTLAARDGEGESLRVIGSIREMLAAPENPALVLARLADPRTRIVTLTITEKGYLANIAAGALVEGDPLVAHDLDHPQQPRSALGFLAEALSMRRTAKIAPFTILSCDNLPSNGALLSRILSRFASLRDPGLGKFVADEVRCPSTMVDRIVPATTEADIRGLAARTGVLDLSPVFAEPFRQWVVEDDFPLGRPGWERSGVTFVADVAPYERMKLRLLNGAHSAIAAISRCAGIETVDEAIAHQAVRDFVVGYWNEARTTIDRSIDVDAYVERLLKRFGNAALRHRTEQIATDASQKLPQRILAALGELRRDGRPHGLMTFVVAAWIRSCLDRDEAGAALRISDPQIEAWRDRPRDESGPSRAIVSAYLELRSVFGDLGRDRAFADEVLAAFDRIRAMGVLAAAEACTSAAHEKSG